MREGAASALSQGGARPKKALSHTARTSRGSARAGAAIS